MFGVFKKQRGIAGKIWMIIPVLLAISCQNKKPSPAKREVPLPLPAVSTGSIEITESSSSGTSLFAAAGKQVNWSFVARASTGEVAQISNISVSNNLMIVSGSTVSFSPTTSANINGQITVSASSGTLSGSQTFIVSEESGGSALGGGVLGVITTLLSATGLDTKIPFLSTVLGVLQKLKNFL